jgi:hypothetical protein
MIMVRLRGGFVGGRDGGSASTCPISASHTSPGIRATAAALRGSCTDPGSAEAPGAEAPTQRPQVERQQDQQQDQEGDQDPPAAARRQRFCVLHNQQE